MLRTFIPLACSKTPPLFHCATAMVGLLAQVVSARTGARVSVVVVDFEAAAKTAAAGRRERRSVRANMLVDAVGGGEGRGEARGLRIGGGIGGGVDFGCVGGQLKTVDRLKMGRLLGGERSGAERGGAEKAAGGPCERGGMASGASGRRQRHSFASFGRFHDTGRHDFLEGVGDEMMSFLLNAD